MLDGKFKLPFFWAAFALSGDWRPLGRSATSP
jgi:CHAT domain-containing protein